MKSKILGYVVIAKDGAPLSLGSYPDHPKKILWGGDGLTLFPTRKQAEGARQRSYEYGQETGWQTWLEVKDANIEPVRAPETRP